MSFIFSCFFREEVFSLTNYWKSKSFVNGTLENLKVCIDLEKKIMLTFND